MQIQFVFLLTLLLIEAPAAAQTFLPTPDVYRALAVISGDSLRGNLSFIAADQLGGRDTPSDGLDLAALYIAAQFRRARDWSPPATMDISRRRRCCASRHPAKDLNCACKGARGA